MTTYNEIIESKSIDGFTAAVHYDPSGGEYLNPREYDNLGIMACSHRNYRLGDDGAFDQYPDLDAVREAAAPGTPIILLGLYDHSGITMYEAGEVGEAHPMDPGGWDSMTVGVLFTTPERIAMLGPADPAMIPEILRGEIREYDAFLRGDAIGYVVTDPSGDVIDSCWGYLCSRGQEDVAEVLAEAVSIAEDAAAEAKAKVESPNLATALDAARTLAGVS